jgi:hypothetical protein
VIARELATIKDKTDLIIFAAMTNLYIQNHDEHIMRSDLEDLFEHAWVMRNQAQLLECGSHPLQKAGLVEYSISDGQADALICPDIVAGNVFYKTLTLFGYAKTAGVLEGTQCCCVVPSRADSPDSKYYSLALAAI